MPCSALFAKIAAFNFAWSTNTELYQSLVLVLCYVLVHHEIEIAEFCFVWSDCTVLFAQIGEFLFCLLNAQIVLFPREIQNQIATEKTNFWFGTNCNS